MKDEDKSWMTSNFQKSVVESVERNDRRGMGVIEERIAQSSEADRAYDRVKEIVGHEDEVLPKNRVKLTLASAERMSLYQQILDRLEVGKPNHRIAQDVVDYVLKFLGEKEKTANTKGATKGPIFRRSE